MSDEELTDEQHIANCKRMLQESLDNADLDAPTLQAGLDSTGLRQQTVVFTLAELRYLGKFDLDLSGPRYARRSLAERMLMARHWVYQRKSDKWVFALGYPAQSSLMATGTASILGLVGNDERGAN